LILEAAMQHLEAGRINDGAAFEHVYEDLMHRYRHRLAAVGGGEEDGFDGLDPETYMRLRAISAGALQAERRTLIGLRDGGRIGDDTLRKLERELDLAETRYQGISKE
jgi:CPA1 family monovalent cation:H+ antiporter